MDKMKVRNFLTSLPLQELLDLLCLMAFRAGQNYQEHTDYQEDADYVEIIKEFICDEYTGKSGQSGDTELPASDD